MNKRETHTPGGNPAPHNAPHRGADRKREMQQKSMLTRAEKKAGALAAFLRWLVAAATIEPTDVNAHSPEIVGAAWREVEAMGLFASVLNVWVDEKGKEHREPVLPLPTVSQAEAYATAHKGTRAYVIDQDRVMLLDSDNREVRQYKGQPTNVAEVPDAAYNDLPRLRRTKTPADPHGRVVRSIGSLLTAGREALKKHRREEAEAEKKAKAKAEAKAAEEAKAEEAKADGKPDGKPEQKSKKGKKGKTTKTPAAPIEG